MRGPHYLGIDAGTQSVKVGLWSSRGELVAGATRPLSISTPHEGWAEQDPESWWRATAAALRALAPRARRAGVAALGVAWQRETFTLTDRDGRALRPALLWLDVRAHEEARGLAGRAARIHELTGVPPDITTTLPRLAWLRRHEPQHFESPVQWEDVGAHLLARLTGRRVTCHAGADTAGMISRADGAWCPEIVAETGLDLAELPGLVAPGEIVGPLLPHLARTLGLPAGLPVVAAGGDGQVFAGAALAGRPDASLTLSLGTSVVLGVPSRTAPVSPLFRTLRVASPGGARLLEAVLQSGTYLFRWLEQLTRGTADLNTLEREAATIPPGAQGLLTIPHWWGARFPSPAPDARGSVLGCSDRHTLAHLYRSLLEGSAFEIRHLAESIGEVAPRGVGPVVAGGGGARSALWLGVLGSVLGRELVAAPDEPVAAGAAHLAARAVGHVLAAAGAEVRATAGVGAPGAGAAYDRLYREVWLPCRAASLEHTARLTRWVRDED